MRTSCLALLFSFTALLLHAQPAPLFDGKTLDNWDYDATLWRVKDGRINGGSLTEKVTHNDFVATKKSYSNFDLRLKIKLSGTDGFINSGVQIRSVRVPGSSEMSGYQVDYGKGWYGKLYDESRRNKVVGESKDQAAAAAAIKEDDWNEYRILANGSRIQSWINGVPALDYTEQDPNVAQDGQLGIQIHGGGKVMVEVKDITIEELPATPNAPTWEKLGGYKPWPKPAGGADATKQTKSGRDISYNDVKGTAKTAEEEQKLFKLPPGYEIELVVKESEGLGKFVSVYFDQRGRLWTQTAFEYPVDANENPAMAEAVYAAKGKDKVVVYSREDLNKPLPAGGLTHPKTFAEGLAIPLGILPWGKGDSCYILHGHDLTLQTDTDGDGKADKSQVVLTGFGVQDSHLFPHQLTRAPGGWIWMAQGLFNRSAVKQPGKETVATPFDMCRMARFRPDGSDFEPTSVGPNNIWGLTITGEGEAFIQEANDYGYPVMPFHEYAYYPGGAGSLKKSYQPDFPPAAEFRMGGTGLSGLAQGEGEFRKLTPQLKKDGICMFVANPITSKVQTIAMHRHGPYWKQELAADLITCDDPFFRPVGMTNGPDGCIYIVDWYNKIISHNEVARNHPDRDKTRGRIWRVRPKAAPKLEIPDFTKLTTDELIALAGTEPAARAHLAWQSLADREPSEAADAKLKQIIQDKSASPSRRIQAEWALEPHSQSPAILAQMANDDNANLRREAMRSAASLTRPVTAKDAHEADFKHLANDPDPTVRAEYIRTLGRHFANEGGSDRESIRLLIGMGKPSLSGPTVTATHGGNKQIPAREAYDREFERFLVRMFLERQPDFVAKFLDSEAAANLTLDERIFATLALEPKASASRVAKLLPQLDRAPNEEELFRLAQFPEEPGCGEAVEALLSKAVSRTVVAERLLAQKTKLDPAKIAPVLIRPAKALITGNDADRALGVALIGGFQLTSLEEDLLAMVKGDKPSIPALSALRELRSHESALFATLAKSAKNPMVREEALSALAASRAPDAGSQVIALYPDLSSGQRHAALTALSGTKAGAKAIVAGLLSNSLPQDAMDGPIAERLSIVLGDDADLAKVMQKLGALFRPVLALDGQDAAWADSGITLAGPFTVETWVRLTGKIDNNDSLLGVPGQLDLNFFASRFRVWAGNELHDVAVAQKPLAPDLWTHIAVTRDAKGIFKIYQNGELDATGTKPANQKYERARIGWSGPGAGTEGFFCEYRVWDHERSAAEIRANFDHVVIEAKGMKRYDGNWGKLGAGARIAKTTDTPPLLTDEQSKALDAKFVKYVGLASKGHANKGKAYAAICMACHQINGQGGQIGPNLSGAGAMGLEGVLRNILTPNAAMEPGYRIFRVEMKNGDIVDAFYVSEDAQSYVTRQPGTPDRRIEKKEVRSTRYIRRSLMPEGLLDSLPEEAVADLLSYLMTLK